MPRFRHSIPVDDYIIDVLMRDLVGHDRQPAAFLVYLCLYRAAERDGWKPVRLSLRQLAESTGLSKSSVQVALACLRRRELIATDRIHATAIPLHRVLRHWRR
jgi:DNA-binding MarR family transcriptional regulator